MKEHGDWLEKTHYCNDDWLKGLPREARGMPILRGIPCGDAVVCRLCGRLGRGSSKVSKKRKKQAASESDGDQDAMEDEPAGESDEDAEEAQEEDKDQPPAKKSRKRHCSSPPFPAFF